MNYSIRLLLLASIVSTSFQPAWAMPPRRVTGLDDVTSGHQASQTITLSVTPRKNSAIQLHQHILEGREFNALAYIQSLINKQSNTLQVTPPKKLYMSVNNPGTSLGQYQYTTPDGRATRHFHLVPHENIFEVNGEFQSALHLAANMGMVDVVKKLLALKINVNFQDGYDRTPLMWAAMCPNLRLAEEIIGLLIHAGADILIRSSLDHRAARQYALEHILAFPTQVLNKLTVNQLDTIATSVHGVKKLPSDLASANGRLSEARIFRLNEASLGAIYRLELRENKSKRVYNKSDDREAIESILAVLKEMFALQPSDMNLPDATPIIKQALELIGAICWGIDKETKGGYLTHLLWPELEYLQTLMSSNSLAVSWLLPTAFQKWQQNDFPELRKRLRTMLQGYDQWEEKNKQSSANVEPTVPPLLIGLHSFIRYFFDLQSLDTIIELSKLAEKLDMDQPEPRRELLTIVRKIGDTSKYEVKGANLSPSIKGLAPEVPWGNLHKLRNILKESTQKVPEVRKLLKLLVKDGAAQGLSIKSLRDDVVLLGQKLEELKQIIRVDTQDPSTFLDQIHNLYAEDMKPNRNDDTLLFLQKKDIQLLETILIAAFNESPSIKETLVKIKDKKDNLSSKGGKISDQGKRKINEAIQELEDQVGGEKKKKIDPLIVKLNKGTPLSNDEITNVAGIITEDRQRVFFELYYRGLRYRSFGVFVSALTTGKVEKDGDRTQEIRAHYLKLANNEWNSLLSILFPDAAQKDQVLRAVDGDSLYLMKTNKATKHLKEGLQSYMTDVSYRIKLNTIIIDFMIYLGNSGIPSNITMRNIMEHFNAPHDVYQTATDHQIFSELLRYIGEFRSELNKRISEFKAGGVNLPIDDTDTLFSYAPSAVVQGAISALGSNFNKIKAPKKAMAPPILQIMPIAPNGHCMFNSTLHGIQQFPAHTTPSSGLTVANAGLTVDALRNIVAHEIETNLGHYFDEIGAQLVQNIRAGEFSGYPGALRARMSLLRRQLNNALQTKKDISTVERAIFLFTQQEAVTMYITALKNGTLWGGDIELGILARLLGIQLHVHKRDGMSYLINGEAAGAPKVELDYTGDHYNLILTPLAASGLMPAATPSPQVYTSTVAPLTQLQQRLEDQEQAAYKSGQGLSAQDLALQTVIEHYKKLRTPLSLQQEEWKEKILTAIRTQVVESQSSIPPHLITVEQPMLIKGELRTCTITLPSHRALKRPTYALLEGDAYTFQYEAPDALDAEKAGEVTLTVNDWDPIPVYRRSKLVLPMAPPPSVKQGEGDGHGPAPEGGQGPTTAPNLGTSNPAPSFSQHPHGGDSPAAEHVDSQGDLGESLNSPSYGMAHDLDKKGDTAPLSYNPSDTSFFSNSLYYCGWALKLMISFSPFQNNPNTSRKWASEKIRV